MFTDHVRTLMLVSALSVIGHGALAADAARLGADLTPLGGEKAANRDGSIPAWQGAESPAAGWSWGKRRIDFWKHKDEKALFTIDASNADKHADKLPLGQLALLKQVPGYRVDVYPSHRTCSAPDFVADNTKKNVDFASLGSDGWSVKDAYVPGIPFPLPANGAQAMWNTKLRYRGVGIDMKSTSTVVSPRKGSNEWIRAGQEMTNFYPWGTKGSQQLSKLEPVEYYAYFAYQTPPALAGQALAAAMNLTEPAEVFYYFPGQRRVRRMPSYAYDSPQIGFENQYTIDEAFVFNGRMDRFDWKLVGKKEMYVQYNSFGSHDFTAKFNDVVQANGIVPGHRRYELHRVWVVEATVKQGVRHSSPKRTFYIDEDSWVLLGAEDYDAQGKIWKVREAALVPVYETGACDAIAMGQHNLAEGRYVLDTHAVGTGKDIQWLVDASGPRFKPGFYGQENLRSISDR